MWKANPTTSIVFPLIVAAAMLSAAMAQSPSPAPAPGLDCFPYILNVSDCLTFVSGGSTLKKPDPGCCPELSTLVDAQPVCLCQLLGNSGGFTIDVDRALKLPTLCNVSTPPVSLCAAIGYPVTVSDLSPSEAPSPGGGAVAVPPSPGGDSGSATSEIPHFFMGFVAIFFSFFF